MNISALFIERPVATTLVMSGLVAFGAMAYRSLPVNNLPNVDFPTIQVSASLPGASPETMAASVATPLEKEFATIAGIDSMTSSSVLGTTQITLQFTLSRALDAAAQDVQAAIARVARTLPPAMPYPPYYRKVNPADQAILNIALTSPTLPLYAVDEYAQTMIAQRVSMVSGVAQVQVYGSQKYAVRVQVDPRELVARNIGLDEVATAIDAANANLPTGSLWGPTKAFTIEADGQLTRAADYRPVVVAYRDGQPVRLADLAVVSDGVENDRIAAWLVDQRAIMLAVQRQPGTNTVEVAAAVRALLPSFRAQLPASVSLAVLFDQSESIRDSVADVKFTLLLTLALVVLVIFLFLRNFASTLISSLALPMSIVGTFVAMKAFDFSLDNLSLMAITLSVGFVVDDAIVVLENIIRHLEMGKTPHEAARDGSAEIGFTVVSMTVSLAAVFIPILFMGGILGRLFNEFAITISVAVLISGVVSLTLTPMMASRLLKPLGGERHGRLYERSEAVFAAALRAYGVGLTWSLVHRRAILALTALVLAATAFLFVVIPKGFIPSEDTGLVQGTTEGIEGLSFTAMVEHQQEAARVLAADPDVEAFMSTAGGGGGTSATNAGRFFVRLKPRAERSLSADEIISRLRPQLAAIAGIRVYLQNPPPIRLGGMATKSQYQLTLRSPSINDLQRVAPLLEAKIKALPGLRDVTTDMLLKNPEVRITFNRDRAAALGVTVEQIEATLYAAYGTQQVTTIFAPNNTYKVILELQKEFQREPAALALLYVRANTGALVPLESLARIEQGVGPLSIAHSGQLPSVTVSFDLMPGTSLGTAVGRVEQAAQGLVPASMDLAFQGTAQAFQSSMQGLGLLLLLAVLVIYLVLGILYESFIHPLTILSALPFAGFGAVVTLMAFSTDLSIYAFVGVIMLVGLVKKNGIMMVDFAVAAERQGKGTTAAIYDACLVRFRPIMMTTMAALFGTLPIALGLGAGAETRRPLGLAVVGGLLFSQTLTLFVTPVIYTYMDDFGRWLRRPRREGR